MERRVEPEVLRSIKRRIVQQREQQKKERNPCNHCVVPTACLHCTDKPEKEKVPTKELRAAWDAEDKEIAAYQKKMREIERNGKKRWNESKVNGRQFIDKDGEEKWKMKTKQKTDTWLT